MTEEGKRKRFSCFECELTKGAYLFASFYFALLTPKKNGLGQMMLLLKHDLKNKNVVLPLCKISTFDPLAFLLKMFFYIHAFTHLIPPPSWEKPSIAQITTKTIIFVESNWSSLVVDLTWHDWLPELKCSFFLSVVGQRRMMLCVTSSTSATLALTNGKDRRQRSEETGSGMSGATHFSTPYCLSL